MAYAGPCWDYDNAYGCYTARTHAKATLDPKGFLAGNSEYSTGWWVQLCTHDDFMAEVHTEYATTFTRALKILLGEMPDDSGVLMSLDEYAERVRASAAMNFIRWPIDGEENTDTGADFEENVEYLRTFITKRRQWLDTQWLD